MTDTAPYVVVKLKADDLPLKYDGADVQFYCVDGVLTVYNYDLRKRDPGHDGLILASAPGEWQFARRCN